MPRKLSLALFLFAFALLITASPALASTIHLGDFSHRPGGSGIAFTHSGYEGPGYDGGTRHERRRHRIRKGGDGPTTAVPEPSAVLLFAVGAAAFGMRIRRR